jgi:hypothetical protein
MPETRTRVKLEMDFPCVRCGEILPAGMSAWQLPDGTHLHYGKCKGVQKAEYEAKEKQFTVEYADGFYIAKDGNGVIELVEIENLEFANFVCDALNAYKPAPVITRKN